MTDNEDAAAVPQADATEPVVPAEGTTTTPVLKTRWRDRAWSFRAMIVVAAAALVIGGIAGGVVVAASGGDDRDHHRMGPWGPGMQMPPGWRERGPRNFGNGGPQWRWDDGSEGGPNQMPPYGTPAPLSPSATPAPGSAG